MNSSFIPKFRPGAAKSNGLCDLGGSFPFNSRAVRERERERRPGDLIPPKSISFISSRRDNIFNSILNRFYMSVVKIYSLVGLIIAGR